MRMQKVAITELSKPVQSFLSQVRRGQGIIVEDEAGREVCGVIPYEEVPLKEQQAALKRLERLQEKVGKTMARKGVSEDDFDRLLRSKGRP